MASEREPEQVKVVDRRLFDSNGNPRTSEDGDASPTDARPVEARPPTPPPPPSPIAAPDVPAPPPPGEDGSPGEMDFTTLVMHMSVNALMALGEVPGQGHEAGPADLEGARQFIDILVMLRQKTRGNLTARESQVLEGNLYELQLKYVEKARGPAAP